jgi:cytochrome c556
MRRMLLCLLPLVLAGCASIDDTPPANPQAVVNERVQIMKQFGSALATSWAYMQGKRTAKAARAKIPPALAGAAKLEDLFPRGTALGDRGVKTSRALSTIFKNRSDFEARIEALSPAFAGIDAALARGSKADTTAAVNAARAMCASCHNKYRAADE